jgi:hypothetical protein
VSCADGAPIGCHESALRLRLGAAIQRFDQPFFFFQFS